MRQILSQLDVALALMREIELDLAKGIGIEHVLTSRGLNREHFRSLLDRYALGLDHAKPLAETRLTKAVMPIFRAADKEDSIEQVASGVLLRISSTTFLLTAAHVTDEYESGHLHVPGTSAIVPLNGNVSYWRPQKGSSRAEDTVDLAYVRLGRRMRSKIHSSFTELTLDDICFKDNVNTVPFASFAGYPATKGRKWAGVCSSELLTYTGHVLSSDLYAQLGYSPTSHVCIRMRRKKTFSSLFGRKMIAPDPKGVSGGAILSWPATVAARMHDPDLRLIGIAHSYTESANCLAGTHIKMFVKAIVFNDPSLRPAVERALSRASRNPPA